MTFMLALSRLPLPRALVLVRFAFPLSHHHINRSHMPRVPAAFSECERGKKFWRSVKGSFEDATPTRRAYYLGTIKPLPAICWHHRGRPLSTRWSARIWNVAATAARRAFSGTGPHLLREQRRMWSSATSCARRPRREIVRAIRGADSARFHHCHLGAHHRRGNLLLQAGADDYLAKPFDLDGCRPYRVRQRPVSERACRTTRAAKADGPSQLLAQPSR